MATMNVALNPIEELLLGRIESASKACPLVSFSELRADLAGVTRRRFDNAVLALARFGRINLYRTDLPRRLMTEHEQRCVLWCGDVAYNACSVRGGQS